jgi:hypothetical protein
MQKHYSGIGEEYEIRIPYSALIPEYQWKYPVRPDVVDASERSTVLAADYPIG